MSMFKDMLKSGETLFRDTVVLDYDFQPKILKFRETEQQRFAVAVRPLLQGHNGRNLFVYGVPGVGKTTACKHVLRELEDETEEVVPIYVNCWKENTTYKIDKLEDTDLLYTVLEDIYRKTIILLTNYRDTYSEMDERIRSRLNPEFLNFRAYNETEIAGILKQRREYAFVQNCWDEEAFKEMVEKCTNAKDVRVGLYLMKEAGNLAEERSSKKISLSHVAEAIKKVDDFHIKPTEDLDPNLLLILDLIRENSGQKIGDLYNAYTKKGGEMSYKSFHRRIVKLDEGKFISTERVFGKEGNTTIINYSSDKKLTDF